MLRCLYLLPRWVCALALLLPQRNPATSQLQGQSPESLRDPAGIPQLGATVEIFAEAQGNLLSHPLLTNTEGVFRAENLAPGLYTVRVLFGRFFACRWKNTFRSLPI